MFSHVTTLSWWKTDHTQESNEDAYFLDIAKGIFVVSDGVSTQFFSRLWATILTQYFPENPLMSNDPFEVEWWLRPSQERYTAQAPDIKALHWSAQQKAKTGSAATLAAVRIKQIATDVSSPSALAELLTFGDSCIFIGNEKTQEVRIHFPVEQVSDFDKAPICVPSLPNKFNRKFHRCNVLSDVSLQVDDVLILATDAVSKWILSSGAGSRNNVWQAFKEIADYTPDTWHDFITRCRHTQPQQMVDDDVTALVVRLYTEQQGNDLVLGTTNDHTDTIIQQRVHQFEMARQQNNKEAVAILYGDGIDMKRANVAVSDEEIQRARAVADALAEVWQAFRSSINSSQFPKKVEDSWKKNAYLLKQEPCSKTLLDALQASGIKLYETENALSSLATKPIEIKTDTPERLNVPPLPSSNQPVGQQTQQGSADKDIVGHWIEVMNHYYDNHDDEKFFLNYEKFPERYRSSLSTNIQERVQQIQSRAIAQEHLKKTLRYATANAMIQAHDAYLAVQKSAKLPQQEQEQVILARALVTAEQKNSDDAVLAALDAINNSGYAMRFQYNSEHQRKYAKVRRERDIALTRQRLSAPHLTVEEGWKLGRHVEEQNVSPELNNEERNKIALATQFKNAFDLNDISLLASVYIAAYYSFPTFFTFSQTEQKLLEEAKKTLGRSIRPRSPVAILEDIGTVSFEQFRKSYIVRRYYYTYKKQFLERQPAAFTTQPNIAYEIETLTRGLEPYHLLDNTLQSLTNDQFLQVGIAERRKLGGIDFKPYEQELKQGIDWYKKDFADCVGKALHNILKDAELSKSDLDEVFVIWARYLSFQKYSSTQWQMAAIEDWLLFRKNATRCIYPEWAAESRESTNTEVNQSWIFKWKEWPNNDSGGM